MKTQKNFWNDTPLAFLVSPDRDFPKSFQTERSPELWYTLTNKAQLKSGLSWIGFKTDCVA